MVESIIHNDAQLMVMEWSIVFITYACFDIKISSQFQFLLFDKLSVMKKTFDRRYLYLSWKLITWCSTNIIMIHVYWKLETQNWPIII